MPPSKSRLALTAVNLGPPDVALEAAVCLDQYDALIGGKSLRALMQASLARAIEGAGATLRARNDAISKGVADLFPVPPGRVQTAGLCGLDGRERMGAWLVPVLVPEVILPGLHVLPAAKLLAFRFSSGTIAAFFAAGWAALTAQNYRLNDSGQPDPNGNLEVKEPPSLTSPDPHTIELKVSGTYHYHFGAIGIDVDFTFVNTETLSVGPFGIRVDTVQRIDLDRGPIDTALAGAFFISLFGGFFSVPTFAMIYSLIESNVKAATEKAGLPVKIGGLVAPVFPQLVLIPGTTSKLVITYDEVTADLSPAGSGIVASCVAQPGIVPRAPDLFIHGPATIVVNRGINKGPTVSAAFNLLAADMRVEFDNAGNVKAPGSVVWSGGVAASSGKLSTTITFNIAAGAAGHTLTRTVSATVMDSDGQTQSASRTVTINIVNRPLPRSPTGRPRPARLKRP